MPARRGGNARIHLRTASTASQKQANNQNISHVPSATQLSKGGLKRSGNSAVEVNPQRNSSPYPRNAHFNASHRIQSKDRVQSKERIQPLQQQQKRAQTPLSSRKSQQNHKAGFSIARSEDSDGDEWVSSESGAATPLLAGDAEEHEELKPAAIAQAIDEASGTDIMSHTNGVATPRVEEHAELPRVETARAALSSQASSNLANSTQTLPPTVNEPPEAEIYRQIRSEAPSPTRRRPLPKRNPLLRNSSHGDYKVELPPHRPHPLIRGTSFQASLKPKPLAPLTVNPEAIQAQISSSPTSTRGGYSSTSPTSMFHSMTLQTPTSAHPDSRPSRKSSISSLHSVATLPVPSPSRFVGLRSKPDRTRTLSTISNSNSSAALTCLNALPTMSRPGTPPLVVHFPIENRRDVSDGTHQLLPPPIRNAHLIFVSKNNALGDSFERILRAKAGR